ncbi:MAG: TatD family hydrolase [Alphaproteobacteria bacterium]
MILVDSHCHLDYPDFEADIEQIMANAAAQGVQKILSIATTLEHFPRVIAVAERFDNVTCTVGIHPHHAGEYSDLTVQKLVDLSQHPKVVGLGEAGLDFFYNHSERAVQEKVFLTHIEAAQETGLPLVIHTRDAEDETKRILTEQMKKKKFQAVLHCYSSDQDLANTALELGLYLSFSGMITFKKAEAVRDVVRNTPLDRILVETDAPYLAPAPHRGKRNEPAYTRHVAEKVAEIKGLSLEEVAAATTANFERLFESV